MAARLLGAHLRPSLATDPRTGPTRRARAPHPAQGDAAGESEGVTKALIAVGLGGAVGTGLRLGLDLVLRHSDATVPVSTIVANTIGSFLLGLLVARVWPVAPEWVRAAVGPGLLGSFTTFSAVMVALVTMTRDGQPYLALAFLGVSLVLGFAAAAFGMRLGRRPDAVPTLEVDE